MLINTHFLHSCAGVPATHRPCSCLVWRSADYDDWEILGDVTDLDTDVSSENGSLGSWSGSDGSGSDMSGSSGSGSSDDSDASYDSEGSGSWDSGAALAAFGFGDSEASASDDEDYAPQL